MRLLNCHTFELHEFYSNPPKYSILSHTWGPDEVLLQDINNGTAPGKAGYKKIKGCCAQALEDGLDYVWIDTCCIDKTNSAELQEAINSMFAWYKGSEICYAYLSDVSNSKTRDKSDFGRNLRASRWFTRGWTLQELIAPSDLVFYDCHWQPIGRKRHLMSSISQITRVNEEVLAGEDFTRTSIAQRMSWASARETTRSEDMAYCLMGLFGVNMPLLYGEGAEGAFLRLQKAIMEKSDDHSIFAWRLNEPASSHGLLAASPAMFIHSYNIVPCAGPSPRTSFALTNRGLCIKLALARSSRGGACIAGLNCKNTKDGAGIGLYLTPIGEDQYTRIRLHQFADTNAIGSEFGSFVPFEGNNIYIPQSSLVEAPSAKKYLFIATEHSDSRDFVKLVGQSLKNYQPLAFSPIALLRDLIPGPPAAHSDVGRVFRLAATASSGIWVDSGTVHFPLEPGGVAGFLFMGKHPLGHLYESSSYFVAVVFGIDIDSKEGGEIIELEETPGLDARSTAQMRQKWLDAYLYRYKQGVHYWRDCRTTIHGTDFRLVIKKESFKRQQGFSVLISPSFWKLDS